MDYSRLKKKKKKKKWVIMTFWFINVLYFIWFMFGVFFGGGIVMTSFSVCKILHVDTNKPVLLFTGALYV